MATSGQIGSRSISAAGDDVGRRRIAANLTLRPEGINSTIADHSLSLSDGGGKIIRFYPRAVASQGQPALPMSDRNGEYNVIRFPHAASAKSALQRWDETAVRHRGHALLTDRPHAGPRERSFGRRKRSSPRDDRAVDLQARQRREMAALGYPADVKLTLKISNSRPARVAGSRRASSCGG